MIKTARNMIMKCIVSLAAFLAAATLTLRAATPPPEKLLPADTLVVLTVPDTTKAHTASGQWASSQLWNDPAMKPFKDKLLTKLTAEVLTPLEPQFGVKFSDYAGPA